ncbi:MULTISPECIES: ATP-binding protein [unclassified Geodermatophilus]|uniref:ATP-binding protein n=1 Tax=unclassified Geodermatophilus TaxID=2637632 RepID=UPI003EF0289A
MAAEPGASLTAAPEPASLDRVHTLLEAVWAAHPDVEPADRMSFAIAVTEVAGNIVAHSGDEQGREFSVRVRVDPGQLEAEFEDSGQRVDVDLSTVRMPDEVAEFGRGLALAVSCVDNLEYRREEETNHWRLVRRRAGA